MTGEGNRPNRRCGAMSYCRTHVRPRPKAVGEARHCHGITGTWNRDATDPTVGNAVVGAHESPLRQPKPARGGDMST